uniref:SFRICE_013207 n=1 Tax=Spodoptera frugiperda TaxID=7108 RepID=A0A2H1VIG8_SPOFR
MKSFTIFIAEELKQMYPGMDISRKALAIVDAVANNCRSRVSSLIRERLLSCIVAEASRLTRCNKSSIIRSMEVQTAVTSVMSSTFAKHLVGANKILVPKMSVVPVKAKRDAAFNTISTITVKSEPAS